MDDILDEADLAMFNELKSKKSGKKDKKKKDKEASDEILVEDEGAAGKKESSSSSSSGEPVSVAEPKELPLSDPCDYAYDSLLDRIQELMDPGSNAIFSLKAPQVSRNGAKKTAWANYHDICDSLKRSSDHVYQYMMSELGTEGAVDGNKRLLIRGRFTQKQIESLLRRYVITYVQCQMCKSLNTNLTRDRDSRLYFVECEKCKSSKSVANINRGFHAVTKQDRKQARA